MTGWRLDLVAIPQHSQVLTVSLEYTDLQAVPLRGLLFVSFTVSRYPGAKWIGARSSTTPRLVRKSFNTCKTPFNATSGPSCLLHIPGIPMPPAPPPIC